MALATGGNSSPFGRVIVIDYDPNENFGRFPSFFSRLYPDDIPMEAVLIDPVGNLNTVLVEKIGCHTYFTDGWGFIGDFYGLEDGAWIKFTYVCPGCFEITIKDHQWVEWIYPPMPEPLEGGFGSGGLKEGVGDQELLIGDMSLFPFYLVKWVSFAEFTGDVLTVAPQFFKDALTDPEAEIYIVDEFGKRWPCVLRRGLGDENLSGVICKG